MSQSNDIVEKQHVNRIIGNPGILHGIPGSPDVYDTLPEGGLSEASSRIGPLPSDPTLLFTGYASIPMRITSIPMRIVIIVTREDNHSDAETFLCHLYNCIGTCTQTRDTYPHVGTSYVRLSEGSDVYRNTLAPSHKPNTTNCEQQGFVTGCGPTPERITDNQAPLGRTRSTATACVSERLVTDTCHSLCLPLLSIIVRLLRTRANLLKFVPAGQHRAHAHCVCDPTQLDNESRHTGNGRPSQFHDELNTADILPWMFSDAIVGICNKHHSVPMLQDCVTPPANTHRQRTFGCGHPAEMLSDYLVERHTCGVLATSLLRLHVPSCFTDTASTYRHTANTHSHTACDTNTYCQHQTVEDNLAERLETTGQQQAKLAELLPKLTEQQSLRRSRRGFYEVFATCFCPDTPSQDGLSLWNTHILS